MKRRTSLALRIGALLLAAAMLAGCGDTGTASDDAPVPESSGPQERTVTWDNTFWVAASIGLGAINTEAQVKRVVQNHAEAGVNMILWYTEESQFSSLFLEECAKYGIYTILMDNGSISGASENWQPITEEEFKQKITPYLDNPQVVGFINWDEPFHEDQYYTMMKERQDWTHKYAPGMLSFINLVPSYGPYTWGNGQWKEHVDTLIERVQPDVLSVDYYEFGLNGRDADLDTSFLWRDLGYLRMKAIETDTPLWFYFQGTDHTGENGGDLTVPQLEFQMNAGLAYGSRWLCYWTSEGSVIDERGFKVKNADEIAALNARVKTVGSYLLDKEPGELYHAGLAKTEETNKRLAEQFYCDDVADSAVFAGLPSSHVILSTFTDDTDRTYVVAVNRHCTETVSDTVQLLDSYAVSALDVNTGEETPVSDAAQTLSLELAPGALQLFILE